MAFNSDPVSVKVVNFSPFPYSVFWKCLGVTRRVDAFILQEGESNLGLRELVNSLAQDVHDDQHGSIHGAFGRMLETMLPSDGGYTIAEKAAHTQKKIAAADQNRLTIGDMGDFSDYTVSKAGVSVHIRVSSAFDAYSESDLQLSIPYHDEAQMALAKDIARDIKDHVRQCMGHSKRKFLCAP